MKDLILTNSAEKDLKKINESFAKNILIRLKEYSTDPETCDVKKLKEKQGRYRLRVGDYRIIFEENNDSVIVIMIAHRKDVYKKLKYK